MAKAKQHPRTHRIEIYSREPTIVDDVCWLSLLLLVTVIVLRYAYCCFWYFYCYCSFFQLLSLFSYFATNIKITFCSYVAAAQMANQLKQVAAFYALAGDKNVLLPTKSNYSS